MKRWIKFLLPNQAFLYLNLIRQRWFNGYARQSYSQEGEDLIIERFLEDQHTGFYVDVGAYHPIKLSNTYRLYRKGWRGLNIDANPGSMTMFHRIRPRDINIEAAVSTKRQDLTYFRFNEPALNTFKRELALERVSGIYSIIEEVNIVTLPLSQLLDQYLPPNNRIDLLTVDVEGLDYDVLQSNDWSCYSPKFVLVECLECSTLEQAGMDPVAQLLLDHHYSMVAKTMNTVLFQLNEPDSENNST